MEPPSGLLNVLSRQDIQEQISAVRKVEDNVKKVESNPRFANVETQTKPTSSLMPPPASVTPTIKAEPTSSEEPSSMALLKHMLDKNIKEEKVKIEPGVYIKQEPETVSKVEYVEYIKKEFNPGSANVITKPEPVSLAKAKPATVTPNIKAEPMSATRLLYDYSSKKKIPLEVKWLRPENFKFERSMRMKDKKEMLGNYRVQLNVAGYEFYGDAELPQQAKHNAAVQALKMMNLPGCGAGTEIEAAGTETSGAATTTSATCGTGQGYDETVNMEALNKIAMRNRHVPEWIVVSESGPEHMKVVLMSFVGVEIFIILTLSELHLTTYPRKLHSQWHRTKQKNSKVSFIFDKEYFNFK